MRSSSSSSHQSSSSRTSSSNNRNNNGYMKTDKRRPKNDKVTSSSSSSSSSPNNRYKTFKQNIRNETIIEEEDENDDSSTSYYNDTDDDEEEDYYDSDNDNDSDSDNEQQNQKKNQNQNRNRNLKNNILVVEEEHNNNNNNNNNYDILFQKLSSPKKDHICMNCETRKCRNAEKTPVSGSTFNNNPTTDHLNNFLAQKCIECSWGLPVYAKPGKTVPTHCSRCKMNDMVNVKSKNCQSCHLYPKEYNFKYKKPIVCKKCKRDGMVNMVKSKQCKECREMRKLNAYHRTMIKELQEKLINREDCKPLYEKNSTLEINLKEARDENLRQRKLIALFKEHRIKENQDLTSVSKQLEIITEKNLKLKSENIRLSTIAGRRQMMTNDNDNDNDNNGNMIYAMEEEKQGYCDEIMKLKKSNASYKKSLANWKSKCDGQQATLKANENKMNDLSKLQEKINKLKLTIRRKDSTINANKIKISEMNEEYQQFKDKYASWHSSIEYKLQKAEKSANNASNNLRKETTDRFLSQEIQEISIKEIAALKRVLLTVMNSYVDEVITNKELYNNNNKTSEDDDSVTTTSQRLYGIDNMLNNNITINEATESDLELEDTDISKISSFLNISSEDVSNLVKPTLDSTAKKKKTLKDISSMIDNNEEAEKIPPPILTKEDILLKLANALSEPVGLDSGRQLNNTIKELIHLKKQL